MEAEDDSDVPGTGAVFTFGKSQFGDNSPNKFWIREDRVCQVVCGDEHTVFVAESGRVFTFGVNEWGQLGLGHKKIVKKPTRIKALKSEKVTQVACGRSHTILATDSGKLYSFGANSDGQLGLGNTDDVSTPTEIQGLDNQKCCALAAGADHSLALFENGSVFVWGNNGEGQLGLGEEPETWQPVKLPLESKVVQISSGYYHSAIVTESGDLYTFGETESGKLGHGDDSPDNKVPQKVETVENRVTHVSCGGKHTAIITADGKLHTCGEGANGQLGHGTTLLSTDKPTTVPWPKTTKIRSVSCGENHTAVVSEKGQLFTFGDGRHGKLGLGEENFANQFLPCMVQRFSHFTVEEVSCGGCHTLVTAKPRLENGDVVSEDEEEEEDSEDEQFTFKRGEWNGSIRNSMDLNGSFMARNRRREKLPDPGDTINRTMPSLDSSLSGHALAPLSATLPALGSRGSNPLNRGKLPSLYGQEPFVKKSEPPKNTEEDDESGVSVTPEDSDEEADRPAIQKESFSATHSAPLPKPRPVPRKLERSKDSDEACEDSEEEVKADDQDESEDDNKDTSEDAPNDITPVPASRSKPSHTEDKEGSDVEDLKSSQGKDDSAQKDSRGESEDEEKVDKKRKKKKAKKEDKKTKRKIFGKQKKVETDSEEEDEAKKEEEMKEEKREESEEEGEEEKKPKKKDKKKIKEKEKKKDKTKDKKKKEDTEDEEDEEENDVKRKAKQRSDESEEEDEPKETDKKKKSKGKEKKDKKKKVPESEEEEGTDDEQQDKKNKNVKFGSEDEDEEEDAESEEDKKKEEEKKAEPKPQEKKKSKTCAIL